MKPADCKTANEAKCAAGVLFEARLVAAAKLKSLCQGHALLHDAVDRSLYDLEHEYWMRADALAKPKNRRPRVPAPSKYAGLELAKEAAKARMSSLDAAVENVRNRRRRGK